MQSLRGLAGEIFAEIESGVTVERFHGCQRRHSSYEKAIAIRKEESAPRQKIPVQPGVPFLYVAGFARTGNDRLGRWGQGKIKRDEHLRDRCRHAIKSLAACRQDLPTAGFERLIVKHSRKAQKIQSATIEFAEGSAPS